MGKQTWFRGTGRFLKQIFLQSFIRELGLFETSRILTYLFYFLLPTNGGRSCQDPIREETGFWDQALYETACLDPRTLLARHRSRYWLLCATLDHGVASERHSKVEVSGRRGTFLL